jgi:osmotically-inducible protein OsmY
MKTRTLLASLLLLAATTAPVLVRADAVTDRRIEQAARESYNYRTVLKENIQIQVRDGQVTLTGTTTDPDHKTLAEETVRNLPGVTGVTNRIEIAPAPPEHSDGWIALKLRTKLLLKGNVSAANTNVVVQDGVVTLTGTAANLAQKELTGVYAREVEGVKEVSNQLVVTPVPENDRSMGEIIDDASITAQVKYALLANRATSMLNTNVTTKDGVISISGVARTAAEKDLVTKLAEGARGAKSVVNTMNVIDEPAR